MKKNKPSSKLMELGRLILLTLRSNLFLPLWRMKRPENIFSKNRGIVLHKESFNTENIILEIINLRKKKANLLGYKNYAEWSLQKSMAKNPETVWDFFDQMMPHTFEKVKEEAKILKENTLSEAIQPYDWNYYTEKIRKNNYNLDENELKPYFELFNVLEKGVFYATTLLYGITFKKRTDLPVYHPDVVVYELL